MIFRLLAAAVLTFLAGHFMPETGYALAIGPALIGAGIGALGGLFGGGGQSESTQLDPATQAFIDQLRQRGISLSNAAVGIGAGIPGIDTSFGPDSFQDFLNPFLDQVLGASNREFDESEGRARQAARIESTLSGTGRGSGAGVLEGTRLGEIDRARASASAGIQSQGFAQASGLALSRSQVDLQRLLASLGIFSGAIGPTGSLTSSDNGAGALERILAGGASGGLLGAGISNTSIPSAPAAIPQPGAPTAVAGPNPFEDSFRPPSLGGGPFRFGGSRFGGS